MFVVIIFYSISRFIWLSGPLYSAISQWFTVLQNVEGVSLVINGIYFIVFQGTQSKQLGHIHIKFKLVIIILTSHAIFSPK